MVTGPISHERSDCPHQIMDFRGTVLCIMLNSSKLCKGTTRKRPKGSDRQPHLTVAALSSSYSQISLLISLDNTSCKSSYSSSDKEMENTG
jgi:hypothetical protein